MNIVQEEYRLPFLKTPNTAMFSNNMSAINNSEFVENSVEKMLTACTVLEQDYHLRVMNPLSVSIDSSGKKHVILDLVPHVHL